MVHPGIHFKAVKGDTLFADPKLSQFRTYFPVKAVAVHAEVGRSIAESDQAGLDLHALSAYINSSYLGSDMPQLGTYSQAGTLIGLPLCPGQLPFTGTTCMGAGPASKFPIPLLGIGMAQAVHFR